MKFEEALKAMREGKKVTCCLFNHRSTIFYPTYYLHIMNNKIVDCCGIKRVLTSDKILNTTWEVVND